MEGSSSSPVKVQTIAQGLAETGRKVEASLLTSIEEHVNSSEFSTPQGLDFLDTKNSLLLSYLIDLTVYLRNRLSGEDDNTNLMRLIEMRTVLDKTRNLDKKLRYQIDKLLTSQSNSTSFAAGAGAEDPLQFRPRVDSMEKADDAASSAEGSDREDLDDDLASARQTLRMSKNSQKDDKETEESAVYRAPRVTAVPYTHDKEDRQVEKDKRQRQRMRASELAKALRSQYGDTPEQEDIHGGSELGKQREAARRMADRESEKTKFEESSMVRLTTTRKEKKERNRLMRSETSNLAAISDVGNLVRGAAFRDDDDDSDTPGRADEEGPAFTPGRHSSGKRKRQIIDTDGRALQKDPKGKERPMRAKNSFQAALFEGGGGGAGKSKKKKNKKR
jgi:U3 small nucleolar ribonucleoprotein protein LCP5